MPTDRMIFSGISLAAAVLLLTASVGPALATEKGWYLGFSVGQSEVVDRDSFDDFCNQLFVVCGDKKSDTAFKGIVGYQINNYFGIEGAYFDLGSPSVSTEAPIVATATASNTTIVALSPTVSRATMPATTPRTRKWSV